MWYTESFSEGLQYDSEKITAAHFYIAFFISTY